MEITSTSFIIPPNPSFCSHQNSKQLATFQRWSCKSLFGKGVKAPLACFECICIYANQITRISRPLRKPTDMWGLPVDEEGGSKPSHSHWFVHGHRLSAMFCLIYAVPTDFKYQIIYSGIFGTHPAVNSIISINKHKCSAIANLSY